MFVNTTYKPKNISSGSLITYRKEALYDPTRTTALRNAFARDMQRRFNELKNVIRKAILDDDILGLVNSGPTVFELNSPGRKAFQFLTKEQKVQAFMDWLEEQTKKGIIQTRTLTQIGNATQQPWTNTYISDSYKRGVTRSRYEMHDINKAIPTLETTGGILASMSTPFHADRVGMLYIRAFEELKDINSVMATQISKVLSQGLVDGDNPRLLAKKLISTIDGSGDTLAIRDTLGRFIPAQRRAEMLARTEVIRAHHVGMVQEFRNWGQVGVKVKAEWQTAEDGRVCEQCRSLEGKIYTLDQIEGMIPLHPMCRCIALPTMPEEDLIEEKPQITSSPVLNIDEITGWERKELVIGDRSLEFYQNPKYKPEKGSQIYYHDTGDASVKAISESGLKASVTSRGELWFNTKADWERGLKEGYQAGATFIVKMPTKKMKENNTIEIIKDQGVVVYDDLPLEWIVGLIRDYFTRT